MSKLPFRLPCITLLLCIFFIYSDTIPVTCSNNETDFRALLAFKNAVESDPMGALSSWNETVHFCSWQGIFCSHRHQNRVVGISLRSQGLMGVISPHLGNLSFLRRISLQNNTFHGQIPHEIGRLRRLEWVDFSNNSLSGEIPRNVSLCTNIYSLNLIDNNLTGSIIPELSSLVKLQALGLTRNRLFGTIPPFIGNFTSLISLSLQDCGMQGEIPESLVQLKSLQLINFSENNLTGEIPRGLFNISTMSIFTMRSNRLQGTIPFEIGLSFPGLRYLYLGDNLFTGQIPISLSNSSSLEHLYLGSNSLTGRVMIDFRKLSALIALVLSFNNLEGDLNFMSSMTNCTRLAQISMPGNLLSGWIPSSIANLSTQLSYLSLVRNQLHGSIPSGIGRLTGLTFFNVRGNDLDGPVPYDMGQLDRLQEVDIGENRLRNEIPFSLGNLTLLNYLFLDQNNFTGNIPLSLSNCSNLLALDISHNNLNGTIPQEIMSLLPVLINIDLSYNAFMGSIPLEIGSLINLEELGLSHNELSGLIPNSLSTCTSLERVYLQSNSFNGGIPYAIGDLRGVQYLDLSQNNLSGEIPRSLGRSNLLYLNLSFNRLEGEVPTLGVFLNETAISLEGNNELCGGIPPLDFPPCSSKSLKKKHFSTTLKILIPVLSVGALCIIIATFFYIFICKRRVSQNDQSSMLALEGDQYLRLSYADLLKSTCGFSESNLLGAGKFGSVYKGVIHDPQTCVAVKVLNLDTKGASKSFMSECSVLRSIRHRNLVKIRSVCSGTDFKGNDFKALIYEYMANGDLDKCLHPKSEDETTTLSLKQRLDIAIDIASALEYLHFGMDSTIVHGDLKPSNVLLDEKMTAHVGDFGLAKVISNIFSTNESSSIGIKGTIGYIPPEYGMSGMVSPEGDVYSYGILLLEMFTGRRPMNDEFQDSFSLQDLIKSALPSQVMEVVDPSILHEYNQKMNATVIKNCIEIGLACSKEMPRDRMLMADVVNELRKIVHMAD